MNDRKKDHINQAFNARVEKNEVDNRFNYEPLLSAHPTNELSSFSFAGKTMQLPIWISSMTGGTQQAKVINTNLARACNEFGLGMGIGSCRVLLEDKKHLPDFDLRPIIGDKAPFYANLGIAQLEQLVDTQSTDKIDELIELLNADGIIIHINPLQEFFQPEGELFKRPPIDTLIDFLDKSAVRVIIKEVGQGMGPKSMKHLLQLPIEAIEFAALGGTNFSLLEMMRSDKEELHTFKDFSKTGHTAEEMTQIVNQLISEINGDYSCKQVIISGGITSILEGYYLQQQCKLKSVIGMGSALLKFASGEYEQLQRHLLYLKKSYQLASTFFTVKHQI